MGCKGSQDCRCRPGVIAFVFMPGIMGTRLKNAQSDEIVWEPGAGMSLDASGALLEARRKLQQKDLDEAGEIDESGLFSKSTYNWFKEKINKSKKSVDKIKEGIEVFSKGGN